MLYVLLTPSVIGITENGWSAERHRKCRWPDSGHSARWDMQPQGTNGHFDCHTPSLNEIIGLETHYLLSTNVQTQMRPNQRNGWSRKCSIGLLIDLWYIIWLKDLPSWFEDGKCQCDYLVDIHIMSLLGWYSQYVAVEFRTFLYLDAVSLVSLVAG